MTREEFDELIIGDKVAVGDYPNRYLVGVVTEKDDMTYQLQSKHFSPNRRKDNMSLVSFAWNEGEIVKKQ